MPGVKFITMQTDPCTNNLACKLTSPQLRERKATVIAQLKRRYSQQKKPLMVSGINSIAQMLSLISLLIL